MISLQWKIKNNWAANNTIEKQESIPVGCEPSAAVAVEGECASGGVLPGGGVCFQGLCFKGGVSQGGVYPSMNRADTTACEQND